MDDHGSSVTLIFYAIDRKNITSEPLLNIIAAAAQWSAFTHVEVAIVRFFDIEPSDNTSMHTQRSFCHTGRECGSGRPDEQRAARVQRRRGTQRRIHAQVPSAHLRLLLPLAGRRAHAAHRPQPIGTPAISVLGGGTRPAALFINRLSPDKGDPPAQICTGDSSCLLAAVLLPAARLLNVPEAMLQFARQRIGKPFSGTGMASLIWPTPGDSWFCAELVAACLQAGGLLNRDSNPGAATPQSLYRLYKGQAAAAANPYTLRNQFSAASAQSAPRTRSMSSAAPVPSTPPRCASAAPRGGTGVPRPAPPASMRINDSLRASRASEPRRGPEGRARWIHPTTCLRARARALARVCVCVWLGLVARGGANAVCRPWCSEASIHHRYGLCRLQMHSRSDLNKATAATFYITTHASSQPGSCVETVATSAHTEMRQSSR